MAATVVWFGLAAAAVAADGEAPAPGSPEAPTAPPLGAPPGILRDARMITVTVHGTPYRLETVITRPAQAGRFPLMILSHGKPPDSADRVKMNPNRFAAAAIGFARRGYAVATVLRRGYGLSDGPGADSNGGCQHADYQGAAREASADVLAALAQLRDEPWADGSRVVLAGVSVGGFTALAAAATHPAGLVAVLAFAPGHGGDGHGRICREDLLIQSFTGFGAGLSVPTLVVYAANDHFFGPGIAHDLVRALAAGGGPVESAFVPGFGEDGHQLLTTAAGRREWQEPVDRFLEAHHLPAGPVAALPPHLRPPTMLGAKGRSAFETYLAEEDYEKAFAASRSGAYAWISGRRTPDQAMADALTACGRYGPGCHPVAVDDVVLPEP